MKNNKLILILTALIITAALVLAFGLRQRQNRVAPTEYEQEIQQIQQQSNSDDPEAIEEDLMETEFEDLDQELQDIEQELEAAY